MPELRELMLILGADRSADDSPERYRVTQTVSPRVVIVEPAADATKEELQTMNGVQAVLDPGESAALDVRRTLSDTEALFVDAYAQRGRSKQRPGEGLDWDAEGFLPPDPQRKR
jgi:hypothetical protein